MKDGGGAFFVSLCVNMYWAGLRHTVEIQYV